MEEASKRFDEIMLDKDRFDSLASSVGGLDGIALVTSGFVTRIGWNAFVYVLGGLKETIGWIWDIIKRFGVLFDPQERSDDTIDGAIRYDEEVFDD